MSRFTGRIEMRSRPTALRSQTLRKNEAEAFAEVTTHLLQRFPGVPEDHVSLLVESERQRLADARIREFLPLLAERAATRHLRTELAGVAR